MHCTTTAHLHTFPYTTLFRSDEPVALRLLDAAQVVLPRAHEMAVVEHQAIGLQRLHQRADLRVGNLAEIRALDRKSTRLNSSHRCISYAVFCLKKKTQTGTGQ